MIEKLLKDHDKLRTLAHDLVTLLTQPQPCDLDRLAALRWDMASTIMTHVAFEDRAFYSQIETNAPDDVRALAMEFRTDLEQAFSSYSDHTKQWTPDRIAREWDAYRTMSMRFLTWLLARADQEETELFPLIASGLIDANARQLTTANWTRDAFVMKDRINGAPD